MVIHLRVVLHEDLGAILRWVGLALLRDIPAFGLLVVEVAVIAAERLQLNRHVSLVRSA